MWDSKWGAWWPSHYLALDKVSYIRWDTGDCPLAVRIYEQEQPDYPPYGPPWDGLVSHWICRTSDDHWVECRLEYYQEEALYGRNCYSVTCGEVRETYARGQLKEVGADPPEERKSPGPIAERPNDPRDAWMTERRLAGKSWKQIRPELMKLISQQEEHQKWKLPQSRQDAHKAMKNCADRDGRTLPPLRKPPRRKKPPRVVNDDKLTAS
jgi:hypothetical protein